MKERVMVTGAAGFIGMHTSKKLLDLGFKVYGIDNLNDYYDISLKKARLKLLKKYPNFSFSKIDIIDKKKFLSATKNFNPNYIVHLAAQAGVRYSIDNPHVYISSNIEGFLNILEFCKTSKALKHLVYASSSSVYGVNTKTPFSELDNVDHPVSLYAASKKSNELMAHCYSHLFNIPTTGLRFFTVYGPWGRPDMALFLFTDAIFNNRQIKVFNKGKMVRDFTYVDDIVSGIIKLMKKPATSSRKFDSSQPNPSISKAPYRVFNIGNSQPIELEDYINTLENIIGKKAKKKYLPIQPGDVEQTNSSTELLNDWIGFRPNTSIEIGIKKFIEWYKLFYKV